MRCRKTARIAICIENIRRKWDKKEISDCVRIIDFFEIIWLDVSCLILSPVLLQALFVHFHRCFCLASFWVCFDMKFPLTNGKKSVKSKIHELEHNEIKLDCINALDTYIDNSFVARRPTWWRLRCLLVGKMRKISIVWMPLEYVTNSCIVLRSMCRWSSATIHVVVCTQ